MGKLTPIHLVETSVWLILAIVFFVFSFEFDQEIEIYQFGATGWPRAILGMLVVVTLGNLYHQIRHGSDAQAGRVGITDDETPVYSGLGAVANLIAILLLPFAYALSLKPAGFYATTPVFIVLVILLLGERRLNWIIGITLLIYILLMVLFMIVLNAPLPQGNVSPFYDISAFMLRMNTRLQEMF